MNRQGKSKTENTMQQSSTLREVLNCTGSSSSTSSQNNNNDNDNDDNNKAFIEIVKMLRTLPYDETIEICEALQICPNLVQHETCPIRFIKCENYNIRNAAKRISVYWKYRKSFFGNDRAFLPMTLTGDGAMSNDDIRYYKMGYQMILPNDKTGKAVGFIDKEQLDTIPSTSIARRCVFYMYHILSENDYAATDGIIIIGTIRMFAYYDSPLRDCIRMILDGMPLRYNTRQVFYIGGEGEDNNDNGLLRTTRSMYKLLIDYVIFFINLLGIQDSQCVKLHITPTHKERKEKMHILGFINDSAIPTQLGGQWGIEAHQTWIQNRIEYDKDKNKNNNTLINTGNLKTKTKTKTNSCLKPTPQSSSITVVATSTLTKTTQPTKQLLSNLTTTTHAEVKRPALFSSIQLDDSRTSRDDHGTRHGKLYSTNQPSNDLNAKVNNTSISQRNIKQPSVNTFIINKETENVARMPSNSRNSSPDELSMLNDALQMIPDVQKVAYNEAKKINPHLFHKECNPNKFLAVENGNPWEAANRIVKYWQLRKEIFGERANAPMLQTGQGTLRESDLPTLGCGATAAAPCDQDGRDVVIGDISRRNFDIPNDYAYLRALFYILTVLSENEKNQTEGIVMILNFVSQRVIKVKKWVIEKRCEICSTVPISFHAMHVVTWRHHTGSSSQQLIIDNILSYITQTIMKYKKFGEKAIFHIVESEKEIFNILEKKYGFDETGLPSTLGGNWKYEQYVQRKQYEDTWISSISTTSNNNDNNNNNTVGLLFPRLNRKQKLKCLTEEERKKRKRELNMFYSRQKRERRKAEVDVIQEQYDKLITENEKLKIENLRLEHLLLDAQRKITVYHYAMAFSGSTKLG